MYGVATFYERFRFKPVGKHVIQACHGTACHVNGAKQIGRAIHQTLQIKDRETTADGLFTLETVACLGCCSLAPVMMIDDKVYGRLNPQRAQRILSRYTETGRNPMKTSTTNSHWRIAVGLGSCGVAAGAQALYELIEKRADRFTNHAAQNRLRRALPPRTDARTLFAERRALDLRASR